uniref:Uncharacterized protein n=1 Tax=Rhizophora mucronata TaxID=61149 RepID=A0A2P2JJM9_RHIMU
MPKQLIYLDPFIQNFYYHLSGALDVWFNQNSSALQWLMKNPIFRYLVTVVPPFGHTQLQQ